MGTQGEIMNEPKFLDDKIVVILCATLLGGIAMTMDIPPDSVPIVTAVVSGLFGVAVGKAI